MDSIFKIIAKVAEIFDKSYDPKKARKIISLLVISLLFGGIVYSYVTYDSRIMRRIDNLEKLSKIDVESIKSNDLLYSEYKAILNDINHRYFWDKIDFSKIIDNSIDIKSNKFISGASIWIFLMLLSPLIYKSLKEAFSGIIVFLLIGLIMGAIGIIIPTFIYPMINYIGYPAFQLAVFIFLLFKYNKKK